MKEMKKILVKFSERISLMRTEANIILTGAGFIILFGMLSSFILSGASKKSEIAQAYNASWACTTDTEICPDGSTVGRIPPYCQFAACPAR